MSAPVNQDPPTGATENAAAGSATTTPTATATSSVGDGAGSVPLSRLDKPWLNRFYEGSFENQEVIGEGTYGCVAEACICL